MQAERCGGSGKKLRLHTAADGEEEEEVIAVVEDVVEGSGSAIDEDDEVMRFGGRQAERRGKEIRYTDAIGAGAGAVAEGGGAAEGAADGEENGHCGWGGAGGE